MFNTYRPIRHASAVVYTPSSLLLTYSSSDLRRRRFYYVGNNITARRVIMEYGCEQCGKSFSRKDNLKRHTNTGHPSLTEPQKKGRGNPLLKELREHEDVYGRLKVLSMDIGKPDLMECIALLLNIRDRVRQYHLKLEESPAHV